jgi:LmbE family N-acetylglucosaminyl deacetylase
MRWIFLSPHFDDAVYSCGGLIWELRHGGDDVEIWTICSGRPPAGPLTPFARELHARWGVNGEEVIATRQAEDTRACARVRAAPRYFGVPDCIYRSLPGNGPLVSQEEDLWRPVHPGEAGLLETLVGSFCSLVEEPVNLISPMGLGDHVDHRLTRAAAEMTILCIPNSHLRYYADIPYVFNPGIELPSPVQGWSREEHAVSAEGLATWQVGVAAYASQLSSFWNSPDEMCGQIAGYAQREKGCPLYQGMGS